MRRPLSLLACAAAIALTCGNSAQAAIRITEWMYGGAGGEFVELTNVGSTPIDMTGWSYDDDSATPGVFSLSGFGIVAAGESVVFTEATADAFRTEWSLPASVKVIGENTTNLGRNDTINIFDATNPTPVDVLAFGDQNIPGTIRAQNASGIPPLAALGANNVALWKLSVANVNGTFPPSVGNDVGSPGALVLAVPEPGTLALAAAAGALVLCRNRRTIV